MSFKTFIIFLVNILVSVHSFSQEKAKSVSNHFLEIGLGLKYYAVRDQGTSPLLYQGYLPGIHLQYFVHSKKFLGVIDENFSIGSLKTLHVTDGSKASSYNNDLTFKVLHNTKESSKYTLYLGGELANVMNVRINNKFNNANLNYDIMVYLAPSAMFEYRTSWKAETIDLGLFSFKKRDRNFKFQYALSVPVVTTILRPGFVTINDFVDNKSLSLEMDNLKLISFNRLFMINNNFNLYYILHNNNMLKFNYFFNFFNYYKDYNPVKNFNSGFFVSVVFRFSNN